MTASMMTSPRAESIRRSARRPHRQPWRRLRLSGSPDPTDRQPSSHAKRISRPPSCHRRDLGRSTGAGRQASGGTGLEKTCRASHPVLCTDNPHCRSQRRGPHRPRRLGKIAAAMADVAVVELPPEIKGFSYFMVWHPRLSTKAEHDGFVTICGWRREAFGDRQTLSQHAAAARVSEPPLETHTCGRPWSRRGPDAGGVTSS